MKIVKKNQTIEFKNSETCVATEYPINDKDINIAVVKIINDRYPQKGWAVNEVCKEMVYIISGKVVLTTESKTSELKTGDVVLLDPGEKYFWEGNCEMVVPCSPAWYPEQHKLLG